MELFQKKILIKSKSANEFIKITDHIEKTIVESKIKNGIVNISSPHTTASIILQENDPTLHRDLIKTLNKIVPLNESYEHIEEGKENAVAHIKSNLLGHTQSLDVKDGKLQLGDWQDIFFVELFEGRERNVNVTVVGE